MHRRTTLCVTLVVLTAGLVLVGCAGDTTSTSLITTSTSTTTTTPGGGATSTTVPPDDDVPDPALEAIPDSFVVGFEERYRCDMGPFGFSDIHAFGAAIVETLRAPGDVTFHGRGAMDIEAAIQAGTVCSGSAVGNHSIDEISGTVDYNSSGLLEAQLYVNGAWYEAFEGEITCASGMPSPGAWEWPAESYSEYIFFAPIEHGTVWEKEVSLGMCTGTITRWLDFESIPSGAMPEQFPVTTNPSSPIG